MVRVDDRLAGALHPSTDDLDELELDSELAPSLRWCGDRCSNDRLNDEYLPRFTFE
jgi:hypothetical protein